MMMIDDGKLIDANLIDDKAQEDVQVAGEDIIIIESEHAFAPLGEPNEQLRHTLMTDRDIADQHPIGAITGLQNELDKINALKTVCSNKRHQADYYLWEDENPLHEVREGLFVSICEDTNRIKICSNEDEIYGVVVGNAAFVGAQAADYQRDYRYALVVYIGAVAVQCELDVNKGDFVTSNPYGIAKKSETGYGARVVAKANIEGVPHAFVALGLLTTQVEEIAQAVDDLEVRMDAAELNIISAINTANEAYKLISSLGDIGQLNVDTVQKADEALDKANTALSTADKLDAQIAKAVKISTQARSIADSAVASAEAIRAEAVATANQALSEITGAIKEIQELSYELNVDFDKTQKELEVKKEAMQREIDEIRAEYEGLDGALADFKKEVADTYATNLAFAAFSTKTSDTIAATKQEAEKTYAKITDVASFQNETTETIAGVRQEASETYATIDSLASLDTKTTQSMANLKQEVQENYATIESVASLKTATSDALSEFKQEVTDTYATQSSVQAFTDSLGQSITKVEEKADANEASIENITSWQDSANKALTAVQSKASANEASITSLTTWQKDAKTSITNVEQKATDNEAKISNLTAWQDEAKTSIANIEQTTDANGATIRHLVAEIDKHSVGEYSQANGLTLKEAANILETGFIYAPTVNHPETYDSTEYYFTKGYHYTWNGSIWIESGSPVVAFSTTPPVISDVSDTVQYWYTDGESIDDPYEAETLYKWQDDQWLAVATLKGNVSSRAVSQIRQTTNSIAVEVTNIAGATASMKTTLESDSAKVNSIAAWPSDIDNGKYNMALLKQHSDGDSSHLALVAIRDVSEDINNPDYKLEELGGATIVLADDEELGSYIQIDADSINLNGAVTANNNVMIGLDGTITAVNANIEGHITATSLTLGSGTAIPSDKVNGLSDVATTGEYKDLKGNPDLSVYATKDELGEYVTDTSLSDQLASYAKTGALDSYLKTDDLNAKLGDLNVAYRGDVQTTQTTDDATGITTTISTYTDADGNQHTTTTYTTEGGNYVLLNRDNQWGSDDSLVKIEKKGLLTANNAVIHGKVYASEGSFTGNITAKSLTLEAGVTIAQESVEGLSDTLGAYVKQDEIPVNIITTDDVDISQSTDENGITTQSIMVGNKTYTSIVGGDFVLTDIGLSSVADDGSLNLTRISKEGLLTAQNAVIYGTIYATSGRFTGDIVANSLTLGNNVTISQSNVDGLSNTLDAYATKDSLDNYVDQQSLSNQLTSYATKNSLNSYVTNASLTTQLQSYATTGQLEDYLQTSDLKAKLGNLNVAYRGDVQTTQTTDSSTGIITTTSKYTDTSGVVHTTTTYTTADSNYVLLNRDNQWGSDPNSLVKISTEGLLDANNAIIRGMVYATGGTIGGCNITNGKLWVPAAQILNLTVDSANITSLSVDKITGGTNVQPITMTNFTATGGAIAGFSITSQGLVVQQSAGQTNSYASLISSFQAGIYKYSDTQVTVRKYNDTSMWYNKAYDITGASSVILMSLPASNCEVFVLAELPTSAHSVTSHTDTSHAIYPYYHNSTPETETQIDCSGFSGQTAYLVINSATDVIPTVLKVNKLVTTSFKLGNDGSIEIPDQFGNIVRAGPSVGGFAIDSSDYVAGATGQRTALIVGGVQVTTGYPNVSYTPITFAGDSSTLNGTWYAGSELIGSSARILKSNIEDLDARHSVLFDNLIPRQFTYNDGSSNRIHYGLIVDELKSAMDIAEITTEECAAYCLTDPNKPNGSGGIRYTELIALCIKEIQTLKQKVKELEKETTNE